MRRQSLTKNLLIHQGHPSIALPRSSRGLRRTGSGAQRAILRSFFVLLLTVGCGLIRAPLEASTPTSPAPEFDGTPSLVQIGYFNSIHLRYDADEWEAFSESNSQPVNDKGEPVEFLRHRSIPGCMIQDNLGRGAPPTWERQVSNRTIGSLEFLVEAWKDTEIQKPVLTVYQHPAGESGFGKRIELVIAQDPEGCIRSAEEVLSLSSDLISGSP